MSRVFDAAIGMHWAILPENLELLLSIASREHIPDIEALEAARSRRMDQAERARTRNGIAIIPVTGPIFRRANLFTEMSGATSTETLSRDFNAALSDPTIRGILLDIDSPGGEANGVHELAQMISGARGKKPISAYVGGLGASGAYWLASAADEIVVDATAILGSIGVVAVMRRRKTDTEVEFVSSQSPNKRPDPDTEKGRAQIQAEIDALADVFIGDVAANRGKTPDQVVNDFNAGGLLLGQAAVDAGMADRLGSFESLLAEMADPKKSKSKSVYASADLEEQDMKLSDVIDHLKAKFGQEDKSAQAEEPAPEPTPEPPAADDNIAAESTYLEDLEAKLAAEKRARADLLAKQQANDAENFVNSMIQASHVYPAEKEQLVALHKQFAADDAAHPLAEGSRIAGLEAAIRARPKHGLLTESLDPETTKVLLADEKKGEMTPERRRELLSKTGIGAAALKLVK